MMDFRATASYQFQLLAALCLFSMQTISQTKTNIASEQFFSVELLSKQEVQVKIQTNIDLIRSGILAQVNLHFDFLQIFARSNSFITALNTNTFIIDWRTISDVATIKDVLQIIFVRYIDLDASSSSGLVSTCDLINGIVVPSGFLSFAAENGLYDITYRQYWPSYPPDFEPDISALVDGFFSGCTPLDGILQSTFDCLYNLTCLQVLADYFPDLYQIDFHSISLNSSLNQTHIPLSEHFRNLFVEQWSTDINYSKYFTACASKSCTYTQIIQINYSYTITLFISLYGGLTILLRTLSSGSIKISIKCGCRSDHPRAKSVSVTMLLQRFGTWLKQLNLFKSTKNRTPTDIQYQEFSTRVYLILLASSIVIYTMFTSLSTHLVIETESYPSFAKYNELWKSYSSTLKCPCSDISVPYSNITSITPHIHQICSSIFVSEMWISLTRTISRSSWFGLDARHFRLLSSICNLINRTTDDALRRFNAQFFVTSNVISEVEFNAQLNIIVNQLIESLVINFGLLINFTRLFTQIDEPFTSQNYNNLQSFDIALHGTNQNIIDQLPPKLTFRLTGIIDYNGTSTDCICALDTHCQYAVTFYDWQDFFMTEPYVVPGMTVGCFVFDTLKLSTLECFYSNLCLSLFYYYINQTMLKSDTGVEWFRVHPLIYDQDSTQFAPETSLEFIFNEMMMEPWNISLSFKKYYAKCAPIYCTYSQIASTKSLMTMIIAFISLISGLTAALHVITPQLVKAIFFFFLIQPHIEEQRQRTQSSFRQKLITIWRKLVMFLFTKIFSMNIFPPRRFPGDIDAAKRKYLGQYATRLYIVLLIFGLSILTIYAAVDPQILTKTFSKPSLSDYRRLIRDHNDTLQCPCSTISSILHQYVSIKPVFHQVCSSAFVSSEWRAKILAGFNPNLLVYDKHDYRRFLFAHFQFLYGLCDISARSVNETIDTFLSSSFITSQLRSESDLSTYINLLLEQSKSQAPQTLTRLLFLLLSINRGNAFISTYGSNYQYLIPPFNGTTIYGTWSVAYTIPIKYDNNCSCAFNTNCTTTAKFFNNNSSEMISVEGFRMGCTPSESFFASNLQCLYNLSCINLIQQQINCTNATTMDALNSTDQSRFFMNITIQDFFNDLFIENWSTVINYSVYFDRCAPAFCSYTYIEQANSLHTITFLLGLYGGLNVVLKWICPTVIYVIFQAYQHRKKRSNIVMATSDTCDGTNISINLSNDNVQTESRIPLTLLRFLFFGILLFLFVGLGFLGPIIYLHGKEDHQAYRQNTISTIMTDVPTPSMSGVISSAPTCQLTFQPAKSYFMGSDAYPTGIAVGNLNDDAYQDLAVANFHANNIRILFGDSNGTLQSQMTLFTGPGSSPRSIILSDFNYDGHLDIATAFTDNSSVGVFLNLGNGSFGEQMIVSTAPYCHPFLLLGEDLNKDGKQDLITIGYSMENMVILFGNGDGTFSLKWLPLSNIEQIVAGDFNNDGILDLAGLYSYCYGAFVIFDRNDGSFRNSQMLPVGQYSCPTSIAVGDFNHDDYLDLAIAAETTNIISIHLGNSNGTFQNPTTYGTGSFGGPCWINLGDFNNDYQLDIVVTNFRKHNVGIFTGIGNGTFLQRVTFSLTKHGSSCWFDTGDFDNDGKRDIAITDTSNSTVIILLNSCDCC
ncbi:unnamed protein product [Adineta ricciae]|uniref:Uncharacterized protein n=2 Tax=Adineta ricciae TaxID=249248 RepID=A0A815BD14_ADIRI|nr:unnamed protein product [Adineta ricciae]